MVNQTELKTVIRRIYSIAKEYYNNDIVNYIVPIFNRLNDHERNVLLTGLAPYIFEIEKADNVLVTYETSEIFDIEDYNQIEMIKLKTWLIKWFMLTVSSGFIFSFFYFIVEGIMGDKDINLITSIIKFIKIIMMIDE